MHYRPNVRRSASPSQPTTNASDSLTGWEMAEAVLGGALVFAWGLAWWFLLP
jgi:hypothetical protein